MEIACPSCAKRFRVPDDKLGPNGRKVRCAACGNVWFQAPPPDAAAEAGFPRSAAVPQAPGEAEAPPPEQRWPEAPHREEPGYGPPPIFDGPHLGSPQRFELSSDADYARSSGRGSRIGLLLGWLLLLLVLAALLAGGWYFRAQIVDAVPQMQQIYDLVELPGDAALPGVALQDVTTQVNTIDGNRVMTITGQVANLGEAPQEVPLLVATVTDASGAVLVEWRFDTGRQMLSPGETVAFETRRESIPRGELSVTVDFVLQ